jgi:hypothetical protein
VHVKIGRLIVRLREIQRDLYTFYTRVYCEFIVIVENIRSAEGHSLQQCYIQYNWDTVARVTREKKAS